MKHPVRKTNDVEWSISACISQIPEVTAVTRKQPMIEHKITNPLRREDYRSSRGKSSVGPRRKDDELISLYRKGMSYKQIFVKLEGRSKAAIYQKLFQLRRATGCSLPLPNSDLDTTLHTIFTPCDAYPSPPCSHMPSEMMVKEECQRRK